MNSFVRVSRARRWLPLLMGLHDGRSVAFGSSRTHTQVNPIGDNGRPHSVQVITRSNAFPRTLCW
jgi:hypothetical protein